MRFCDSPEFRPVPSLKPAIRARILQEVGHYLFVTGRLREGQAVLENALAAWEGQSDSYQAAIVARLAREAHLLLGNLELAESLAHRSVEHANNSKRPDRRLTESAGLGQVLHHRGKRTEAKDTFESAETILRDRGWGEFLISFSGFWYCDFLLDELLLEFMHQSRHSRSEEHQTREGLRRVRERADLMTRKAAQHRYLIDTALARCVHGLAETVESRVFGVRPTIAALEETTRAVADLRRTGQQHHLVRGLLIRSEVFSHAGETAQAIDSLQEAEVIAHSCDMQLLLADIRLCRARLFHGVNAYPWKSPQEDLASARRLIEQCGYHRRDEELADVEAGINPAA